MIYLSKIDELIKKKANESEEWLNGFVEESLKLEFSVILTQLRESTSLSILNFSKHVGVPKDIIERIENADYPPSISFTRMQEIAYKLDKRIEIEIVDQTLSQ